MNVSEKRSGQVSKGNLFILSAPSGAGKTTLCRAILKRYPEIVYSISYTTRPPRKGETEGVDYHFISTDRFEAAIREGRWAEWAKVHDNYYGTSADAIDRHLSAGRDILLDIDVVGTRQILKKFPEAVTIFIMPPNMAVLENRLRARGSDDPDAIARRLENAETEIASRKIYRHIIVNDKLDEAIRQLASVIDDYRQKSGHASIA